MDIIEASNFTESKTDTGQTVVEKRPIVLVFHDSSQDVKYLKALGVNIFQTENILEVADTRDMSQYIARDRNPAKLAAILNGLGLPYRYLHNAGNDAVYTMQAMVGIAIHKRQSSLIEAGTVKEDRR